MTKIFKKLQNTRYLPQTSNGFTLLELLLIVAVIAILATVVIVVSSESIPQARNNTRQTDINAILNSVYQYAIDNNGTLPASITTTPTEICKTGGTCTGLIDLSVLTTNSKYLVSLPFDPKTATTNGTGYRISKDANSRVTVSAPGAELSQTITITR
jgi:prepilin-type N-terminal cleavage/methylation domain-containing protein